MGKSSGAGGGAVRRAAVQQAVEALEGDAGGVVTMTAGEAAEVRASVADLMEFRSAWSEIVERLAGIERDLGALRSRVAPGYVLQSEVRSASQRAAQR